MKELDILKMETMSALEKLIWMPSENSSKICYDLFEDKKAIKFMDKHLGDEELINRIYDKYYRLAANPYNEAESSFKNFGNTLNKHIKKYLE